MAQTSNYTCDVCGAERGPENHWLLVSPSSETDKTPSFSFYPWSAMAFLIEAREMMVRETHQRIAYAPLKHICGQACAAKLVSQTTESWK